eukprot:3176268-Rhodomonas_salina.1
MLGSEQANCGPRRESERGNRVARVQQRPAVAKWLRGREQAVAASEGDAGRSVRDGLHGLVVLLPAVAPTQLAKRCPVLTCVVILPGIRPSSLLLPPRLGSHSTPRRLKRCTAKPNARPHTLSPVCVRVYFLGFDFGAYGATLACLQACYAISGADHAHPGTRSSLGSGVSVRQGSILRIALSHPYAMFGADTVLLSGWTKFRD